MDWTGSHYPLPGPNKPASEQMELAIWFGFGFGSMATSVEPTHVIRANRVENGQETLEAHEWGNG